MEDRRVRRTRRQLREGLIALLGEKDIREITVKELTQRADVNRGTFYVHYRDVYDMREQVENELFGELAGLLDAYSPDQLRQGLRPILLDVFRFVGENAGLCALLLGGGSESAFFQRLKELIRARAMVEWGEVYGLRETPGGQHQLTFLVAGAVGIIRSWLAGGRAEPPEEMAELVERLILRGIQG